MLERRNADKDIKGILWEAADKLRGNIDASEYKQVFLGLIFLKYVSEKFDRKYRQLKEEGKGFEANTDEYTSCGIYFIPPNARWSDIMEHRFSDDIGHYIDDVIHKIERENPSLRGIMPKYYARAELDKHRLTSLIELFDEHIDTETDNITPGQIYEYCLMRFAEREGRRAGEFYTPDSVVKTIIQSVDARSGRLYDPCCGSGGMFICAEKYAACQNGGKGYISYYGQDSNPTTWKMCVMNLAIHGIEVDVGSYNADTFFQDLHSGLKADFAVASPPFNMSEWGKEKLWNDSRWQYGMPPAGNANYAWIQHMIHHLSPTGRMGVVLSNGTLTTQIGAERGIRRKLVENDLIECIVSMPSHLFYNTSIPVSLWFINKNKRLHQQGRILFLDASSMGTSLSRSQVELSDDEICIISDRIQNCRNEDGFSQYRDEAGLCALIGIEEIRENDYALVPGRYVGISNTVKNISQYQTSLNELTKSLKDLMHENHRLERELEQQMGALGYDI